MSRREVWQSWLLSGEEVEALLRSIGAWLTGHFVLASERHSAEYMDNDPLFVEAHEAVLDRIAHALAATILLSDVLFDAVTGPAEGGLRLAERVAVILTKEVSRPVAVIRNRKQGKEFVVEGVGTPFTTVLLEDTVTTGGSLVRYAAALRRTGSEVALCVAIFNREGRTAAHLGFSRFEYLLEKRVQSFDSEECSEVGPCRHGPEVDTTRGRGAEFVQKYGQRPRKGALGIGP